MQIGEAFVLVRPKTDQFASDLESDVGQAGQRASTSLGQALTAGAAVAGFNNLIQASSHLNEAVNVTGLVFDQSEDKISQFAAGAAESIGQSERAARTATATFGGLLENVGFLEPQAADTSIALTRLASDLGSAFDKDPEEAVVALTSALRGETEPIRAFNVQLDDMSARQEAVRLGFAETTGEVDQQGLVQGRLSLIMAQTSAVQGDFANTSTEAANAQRTLDAESENSAASMGDNFLPAYKSGLALVQALATGFGALPGPVQTSVVVLSGIAALKGPVGNALGGIGDSLSAMRARFTEAGGGAKGLSAAITPGALGVAGAAAGLVLLTDGLAQNAARAAEAKARYQELTDAFAEGGAGGAADTLLDQISDQAPEAIDAMNAAGVSVRDLVDAAGDSDAFDRLIARIRDTGQLSDIQTIHLYELAGASGEAAAAADALGAADEANTDAAAEHTGSLTDQADALSEVADSADEARDKLDALYGIQQSLDEATLDTQASFDSLRQSVHENGSTLDVATEAGRSNLQALRDTAASIAEQTIAYRANGASVQEAQQLNRFLTAGLRAQAGQWGLNTGKVNDAIDTYGRVPRQVLTDIAVTGTSSGLASLESEIRAIADAYNVVDANRAAALHDLNGTDRSVGGGGKGPTPRDATSKSGDTHVQHVINVSINAGVMFGDADEFARHITPMIGRELDRYDRSV